MKSIVAKRSRSTTPPESNGKAEHVESSGDKSANDNEENKASQNATIREENKSDRSSTTIKIAEIPVANSSQGTKNEIAKSNSSGSIPSTTSTSNNHSSSNFEEKLKRPDLKGCTFKLFVFKAIFNLFLLYPLSQFRISPKKG